MSLVLKIRLCLPRSTEVLVGLLIFRTPRHVIVEELEPWGLRFEGESRIRYMLNMSFL
jgi:hypothetical protein